MTAQVVGFPEYEPINDQQRQFHASTARHKLLIGGYGGGKSYPAQHETFLHALSNPHHHSMVLRNTWKDLEDQTIEDMLRIGEEAKIIKKYSKADHEMYLINDHKILFRPLSIKRDNIKGAHLCQFYVDDPNVKRYQDTISFLMSRLRNPPHVKADRFQSVITANWEGRDWLWKNFMKDREPGGNGRDVVVVDDPANKGETKEIESAKAYWMCPTDSNPTLHDGYIDDLAATHSAEWMDRYVFCKDVSRHSGIIYYGFDGVRHHKDRSEVIKKPGLLHILAVDVGGTHPTAVIHMATDGKAIYCYDEWYKKDCKISDLGKYLQQHKFGGQYKRFIIDPSAGKNEMTSKTSVKKKLQREWKVNFENGNNNVDLGILSIQDALDPADADPYLFIDKIQCKNLAREIEIYRWSEPRFMDMDDMEFEQKPIKKNDDCVDAMRYGFMFLSKYLRRGKIAAGTSKRVETRQNVLNKSKYYQRYPKARQRAQLKETYKKAGVSPKKMRELLANV